MFLAATISSIAPSVGLVSQTVGQFAKMSLLGATVFDTRTMKSRIHTCLVFIAQNMLKPCVHCQCLQVRFVVDFFSKFKLEEAILSWLDLICNEKFALESPLFFYNGSALVALLHLYHGYRKKRSVASCSELSLIVSSIIYWEASSSWWSLQKECTYFINPTLKLRLFCMLLLLVLVLGGGAQHCKFIVDNGTVPI